MKNKQWEQTIAQNLFMRWGSKYITRYPSILVGTGEKMKLQSLDKNQDTLLRCGEMLTIWQPSSTYLSESTRSICRNPPRLPLPAVSSRGRRRDVARRRDRTQLRSKKKRRSPPRSGSLPSDRPLLPRTTLAPPSTTYSNKSKTRLKLEKLGTKFDRCSPEGNEVSSGAGDEGGRAVHQQPAAEERDRVLIRKKEEERKMKNNK